MQAMARVITAAICNAIANILRLMAGVLNDQQDC
jgi:hypothetical protein